ncbi:MerR family transcriptional regulator [Actinoplanes sp. NPDC051494]|uniref:DNA polymerase III subunit beta family protein n=1 Tax=Actinoplanes sp. NPDC051494 TaxID=3363907 RepID=UPI0037A48EC1
MLGIGEVARASGLGVSALRYYDTAGVLVPAEVDPVTGYRRYSAAQIRAARLVAGLRRVGMPVAGIARVVAGLPRPDAVRKLLDEHLARLEDGLGDARREIARLHALLDPDLEGPAMTLINLPAAELAAALDLVRFAASADPALPMLNGILMEVEPGSLTLVATDRFRLAAGSAAGEVTGPAARLVAPLPFADALRPLLTGPGTAVVELTPARISVVTPAGRIETEPLDVPFPDHHRLGSAEGRRIPVDTAALRAAVAAAGSVRREHEGESYEVTILTFDPDGTLRTAVESEWAADEEAHVAVNREFLLQALDAGGPGQLVLELDGPIKPLSLRHSDGYSLLMPVRR